MKALQWSARLAFISLILLWRTVNAVKLTSLPRVVIVGGGPCGLSAALVLHSQGWRNITILEQRQWNHVDFGRSYTYVLNVRGQRLLKSLSLHDEVIESSVLFGDRNSKLNIISPKGTVKRVNLPFAKSSDTTNRLALSRQELLNIFLERINSINSDNQLLHGTACIDIIYNSLCRSISINDEGALNVSVTEANSTATGKSDGVDETHIPCDFLLGCDGINSAVRQWLASAPSGLQYSNILDPNYFFASKDFQAGSYATAARKKFSVQSYALESAGLLYKFLLSRPSTTLTVVNDKKKVDIDFVPEQFYSIRGRSASQLLSRPIIGFLPVKRSQLQQARAPDSTYNDTASNFLSTELKNGVDTTAISRTANFIRNPDDKIWLITETSSMRHYLQSTFPQIDWDSFVTPEELERFTKAKPGRFPEPQHVHGLQTVFYGTKKRMSEKQPTACVALLGDAAHAFPPDLGQGVVAALEDVRILQRSLTEHPQSIERALRAYEEAQLPEAQAICQLMVHGYPQQYSQSPLRRLVAQTMMMLRLACARVLPGWISAPVFYLVQQEHSLTYRQILERRANSNRFLLRGLFLSVVTVLVQHRHWLRLQSVRTLSSLASVASAAASAVLTASTSLPRAPAGLHALWQRILTGSVSVLPRRKPL